MDSAVRINDALLGTLMHAFWLFPYGARNHVPSGPLLQDRRECNLAQIERKKPESFELTGNGPDVFAKRSALKFSDSPFEFEPAHPQGVPSIAQRDPAVRIGR